MKKLFSLVLSLLLLLGLVSPYLVQTTMAAEDDGTKKLTIFHTNDMHGRLVSATNSSGVLTQIGADYVKKVKSSVPGSLLVDAGDATQGLPFANISKGADVITLMNAAGYDAMTLGNHEFDFGKEQTLKNVRHTKFPVLSANTFLNGKPFLEGIQEGNNGRNQIKVIDGVKVGIFGITTEETAYKTNPKNIEGVTFANAVETSKKEVAELKAAGAQVVVGLMHIGNDSSSNPTSEDIAKAVDGLDVLIDGHSHSMEQKEISHTLVVQVTCYSAFLGKVEIEFSNGEVKSKKSTMMTPAEVQKYGADPEVSALAAEIAKSQEGIFKKVIGRTKTSLWGGTVNGMSVGRLTETNLGNLIADSMYDGAKSQIKGTEFEKLPVVSLENGGGIRETIPAGYITRGQVISVLPFGNLLSLKVVTPNILYDVLENGVSKVTKVDPETGVISGVDGRFPHIAGMRFEYDPSKQASNTTDPKNPQKGERVTKIVLLNEDGSDRQVLNRSDQTTQIVLSSNDFEVAGGDGYTMLKDLKNIGEGSALDVLLEEYLAKLTKEGKGIFTVPPASGRIKPITDHQYQPYAASITLKNNTGIIANKSVTYAIDGEIAGKVKTDQDGMITIKEIPSGPHSITITDGNLSGEAYVNNIIGTTKPTAVLSDTDPVQAGAVINIIEALRSDSTLSDEKAVQYARASYEELTDDQKALVTNVDLLVNAEKRIADLKAAKSVEEKIADLPESIKLSDSQKILDALQSYNKLAENQKVLVPNLNDLLDALEQLTVLLVADQKNQEAARTVAGLIDLIPSAIDVSNYKDAKMAIEAARASYNQLTDNQKARVYNYKALREAERELANLQKVKSVSLNTTKASLNTGKTLTLKATINPTTAINKKVSWSTDHKAVATVDSNGKVTAKKAGKATITVKTADGGKIAKCVITVTVPVKSVKLNKTSHTMKKGSTYQLNATINPSNATNKKVTWSSSNKKVVSVDTKGRIKALKAGKAVITVKTADGGKIAKATFTILEPVKSIKLNKNSHTMVKGKTVQLKALINPSNATNKKVTWSSSNKKIVTVDKNGKVTAKGRGQAIITVKTSDGGKKATAKISVK